MSTNRMARSGDPGREIAEIPECPMLDPRVRLLGEVQGSGFVGQQWLVQFEGRFVQLSELLYRIAEHLDGRRTLAEIAVAVAAVTTWEVEADDVAYLLRNRLIPLGFILTETERAAGAVANANRPQSAPSLLFLQLRRAVFGEQTIEPIARVLQVLFAPPVLIPVLVAIAVAHGGVLVDGLDEGLMGLVETLLYTPGLMLASLGMMFVTGFVHEFGHAAALRYGGGRARSIGVGIYLMDPAFYTDVTDSYRLGRGARLRTGFGGIYFDLILSTIFIVVYRFTGHEAALVFALVNTLEVLTEFSPLGRYDGYWLLADLVGVPDFFALMKPFLRSVLPLRRWNGPKLAPLKPFAKVVFALYAFLVVPAFAFFLALFVWHAPDILWTALNAFRTQAAEVVPAWGDGAYLHVAALISQLLMISLTVFGVAYFLFTLVRSAGRILRRGMLHARTARIRVFGRHVMFPIDG
jgi:putative peptide zinc metalloprotease protein